MASTSFKESKHRSCEAANCEERQKHLYKWPTDPKVAAAWTRFVSQKRANFKPDRQSSLCFKHFKDDDFVNFGMYKAGVVDT